MSQSPYPSWADTLPDDSTTPKAPVVRRVPWAEHVSWLDRSHRPGQHFSVFAPTDSGKTHLTTRGILPIFDDVPGWNVLIVDVKGDDPILRGVGKPVHKLPSRFSRMHSKENTYRLVVPEDVDAIPQARAQVIAALRQARQETRWVILLNEVRALTDARAPSLGIGPRVEQLWLRGRPHVTVIAETQRAAWVPGSMYDQPVHVYLGKIMDTRSRLRFREIGGKTETITAAVDALREHEFVYVNRVSGEVSIVKVGR